ARLADGARHEVAQVLEVHVPGNELGVGVGDRDDRLAEVVVPHAGGAPERARSGGVAAVGGDSGPECRHGSSSRWAGRCALAPESGGSQAPLRSARAGPEAWSGRAAAGSLPTLRAR